MAPAPTPAATAGGLPGGHSRPGVSVRLVSRAERQDERLVCVRDAPRRFSAASHLVLFKDVISNLNKLCLNCTDEPVT